MPFDGPRTDKESEADLGVGSSVRGQSNDLFLLGRQCAVGTVIAGARQLLAGCDELDPRSLSERVGSDGAELFVGESEVLASVGLAALAPQKLAVQESSPREVEQQRCPVKAVERGDRSARRTRRALPVPDSELGCHPPKRSPRLPSPIVGAVLPRKIGLIGSDRSLD